MSTARLEELDLAIPDFNKSRDRYARAVQEGRMLEGAGSLDADVEVVGGVGDEDPLGLGGGFADGAVEYLIRSRFGGFLLAGVGGGVGVCLVV